MEMKKYLLMMLVVLTGIVSSCKFDDEELWDSVDDLANRVSAMESLTTQMNSDIAAMQAIVTAVENQVAVSEVEKLTDGYILHFTNGTTATIKNGKDGANGSNGTDGEDGKDGVNGTDGKDGKDAPAMGIAKENGVYYWTLTVNGETDWLTDADGYKIPVTGADGADGDDGYSGSTGSSAKTPTLSVDNDGYWMVSYGGTPEYILNEGGDKISALGVDGKAGVAQFLSVTATDESVTIVKNDAAQTTFVLPRIQSLVFYDNEKNVADIKNLVCTGDNDAFEFTYELYLKDAKYQVVDDNGVDVEVDMDNNKVSLKLQSNSITASRVLLLFYNESTTLTSVFKFKVQPWDGQTASEELKEIEGESNTFGVATPADLKYLAMLVNNPTQVTGRAAGDATQPITYKLQNDIDLSGHNWEPIGLNDQSAFTGVFDGNGYSIKGLSVKVDNNSGATGAGLFGVVENATLKGVTLKDASVDVQNDNVEGAGLLVGRAKGAVVLEEVIVEKEEKSASQVTGSQNTGSVAGVITSSDVTIKNCEVKNANVKTADQGTSAENKASAGGVVGTLNVVQPEDGSEAKVAIDGNKVDGIDLSATTEESGATSAASTSMGGVVGSLNIPEDVNVDLNVSGNSVANTQVSSKNDSAEGGEATENENSTQGTVVGNLSELDSNVAGNIMKDNEVSEDTQIENQLTVSNLQTILNMVVTSGNVNTFDVKGTDLGNVSEITVPSVGADVTLNFASLVTSEGTGLTIKQGTGASGTATNKLTINMSKENQYLDIQAPQSTVTLSSGKYAKVTSLTAKNTLIVEAGVEIEYLEVAGGNVQVFGHVVNLVRAEGVTESIVVTIEEGGQVDYTQSEGFEVVDKNVKGDFVEQKDGSYVIYTAKGWKDFANMINDGNTFEGKTIKLGADIDLRNELQTPIGVQEQLNQNAITFAGTLDGQNHCIKNLKIDNSVGRFTGLFAYIQKATFKNLRIASGEVKGNGSSYVGAFLGYGRGVTFINCHNEGCKVVQVGDGSYAGGLTGALNRTADQSKYSFIIACTNSAEVSGVYCPAGITGGAWGGYVNIVACVNTGKISYSGSQTGQLNIYAAGIASSIGGNGWLYGCFTDCEIVPDGYNHSGLVSDLGYTGENINYSYSTNTELPLLTFGWGGSPENKTVGYSSYNDAVDNLNKGIQLYNWNATVPCTYQFVKGDKPTLVYTEPSTNPGGGSNNFGNGGKF